MTFLDWRMVVERFGLQADCLRFGSHLAIEKMHTHTCRLTYVWTHLINLRVAAFIHSYMPTCILYRHVCMWAWLSVGYHGPQERVYEVAFS